MYEKQNDGKLWSIQKNFSIITDFRDNIIKIIKIIEKYNFYLVRDIR